MDTVEGRHQRCHCGKLAKIQTSWTNSNPGRRFLVFPNSKWLDPKNFQRSKMAIPGLLRKIYRLC
ncbi:hypothetical protein ACE6H2_005873 [Prunus campanulata]